MPYDNLPWQIGLPLAAVAWLVLLWMIFDVEIKGWFQDYFAMRRHQRRVRNRQRADAAARQALRTGVRNGAMTVNEARSVHLQTINAR